jgi:hypothetical protein
MAYPSDRERANVPRASRWTGRGGLLPDAAAHADWIDDGAGSRLDAWQDRSPCGPSIIRAVLGIWIALGIVLALLAFQ